MGHPILKNGLFSYETRKGLHWGFRIRVNVPISSQNSRLKSTLVERKGFKSKTDAARRRDRVRAEAYEHTFFPEKYRTRQVRKQDYFHGPTIKSYFTNWLSTYAIVNCKPSTSKSYTYILDGHVFPKFGHQALGSFTSLQAKTFLSSLHEQGLKKGTIQNIVTPLREGFRHAIEDGLVQKNPFSEIGRWLRHKEDRKTHIQPLNAEESQRLLEQAKADSLLWFAAYLCLVRTGIRPGELLAVKWIDLDPAFSTLEIRRAVVRNKVSTTKTHKIRRVDLSKQLGYTLILLSRDSGRKPGDDEYIFLYENRRMTDRKLRGKLKELLCQANLPKIRVQDLRHTCASLLIAQNANPKYIQKQLGHGSIRVTMDVYGHLFQNDHRHFVDQLDDPSMTKSMTVK